MKRNHSVETMLWVVGVAALVTFVLLGGCSSPPQTKAAISQADNVRVCQHYKAQRAWVHSLVNPTFADAVRFQTDLAFDNGQATPGSSLNMDLMAMITNVDAGKSLYAASVRVVSDCQKVGVTGW